MPPRGLLDDVLQRHRLELGALLQVVQVHHVGVVVLAVVELQRLLAVVRGQRVDGIGQCGQGVFHGVSSGCGHGARAARPRLKLRIVGTGDPPGGAPMARRRCRIAAAARSSTSTRAAPSAQHGASSRAPGCHGLHRQHRPALRVGHPGIAARQHLLRVERRQPLRRGRPAAAPGARAGGCMARSQPRRAELLPARVPHRPRCGAAPGAGAAPSDASALALRRQRARRPRPGAAPARPGAAPACRSSCVHAPLQALGQAHRSRGQRLGAGRRGQFGRGRGRGRAQVGGQVGQRDVGLVADAADHRDRRRRDGAHHALVVEGPQVFQRAAAAHQQQRVDLARALPPGAAPPPARRRLGALHRARIDDHAHLRRAPCQRGQHVVQRRRARAR